MGRIPDDNHDNNEEFRNLIINLLILIFIHIVWIIKL